MLVCGWGRGRGGVVVLDGLGRRAAGLRRRGEASGLDDTITLSAVGGSTGVGGTASTAEKLPGTLDGPALFDAALLLSFALLLCVGPSRSETAGVWGHSPHHVC